MNEHVGQRERFRPKGMSVASVVTGKAATA